MLMASFPSRACVTTQGQRQEGTWVLLRVCWGHLGTLSSSGKGIELPPGPGRQADQERVSRVMTVLGQLPGTAHNSGALSLGTEGSSALDTGPARGKM